MVPLLVRETAAVKPLPQSLLTLKFTAIWLLPGLGGGAGAAPFQDVIARFGGQVAGAGGEAERGTGAGIEVGVPAAVFDQVLVAGVADDLGVPDAGDRQRVIELEFPVVDRRCLRYWER